jgi:hypothetical protein
MKSRYDSRDYAEMERRLLPFTAEDRLLIQRGLAHRASAAQMLK